MPGFDGTGPRGEGPLTGGGRGFCATEGWTGRRGLGLRRGARYRGAGYGTGRGLGWRRADIQVDASPALLEGLADRIDQLSQRVDALADRLTSRGGADA
jgi:hypothetical protein